MSPNKCTYYHLKWRRVQYENVPIVPQQQQQSYQTCCPRRYLSCTVLYCFIKHVTPAVVWALSQFNLSAGDEMRRFVRSSIIYTTFLHQWDPAALIRDSMRAGRCCEVTCAAGKLSHKSKLWKWITWDWDIDFLAETILIKQSLCLLLSLHHTEHWTVSFI